MSQGNVLKSPFAIGSLPICLEPSGDGGIVEAIR